MRRRLRKQITVLAVLAAFFGAVGTLVGVSIYEPPPPPPPPPPQFEALLVRATHLFRGGLGLADLVALVRNPNAGAGIREVPYVFTVRAGDRGVAEISGTTYLLPGQEKPVVALNVPVPEEADRVELRFGAAVWVPVAPSFRGPSLVPVSRVHRVLDGARPRYEVKGVLANQSDLDYLTVDVTALGLDANGAVLGVGKTLLGSLLSLERREYTVSWPLPLGAVVSEVRVYPEVNVFSPSAVQPRTGVPGGEARPMPTAR